MLFACFDIDIKYPVNVPIKYRIFEIENNGLVLSNMNAIRVTTIKIEPPINLCFLSSGLLNKINKGAIIEAEPLI